MEEQFYTVKEAAAVAHLSGKWMGAMIAKIPGGFKTNGPKGDWRISREDLEKVDSPAAGARVKFNTVVIDPPWPISMMGRHKKHSAAERLPYHAMTMEEIGAMGVASLLNPGAHVYLWCTNKTLQGAFEILEKWGIRYHLTLVMTKPSGLAPAIGYVFGTEFCLLGIYGKPMQKFLKCGTLNHFPHQNTPGQHSVKPDSFYKMVERMSPGPYADIFARRKREGWAVWGDEVEPDFKWIAQRQVHG